MYALSSMRILVQEAFLFIPPSLWPLQEALLGIKSKEEAQDQTLTKSHSSSTLPRTQLSTWGLESVISKLPFINILLPGSIYGSAATWFLVLT